MHVSTFSATAYFALASSAALAADPLGLYIGGSVGEAHVRSENSGTFYNVQTDDAPIADVLVFNRTQTGWKLFAGARPLSFLGVEAGYTDFGRASSPPPYGETVLASFSDRSTQTAGTVFAVGYLPVPIPHLDFYAKVGAARLLTADRFTYEPLTYCFKDGCSGSVTLVSDQRSTSFAYGAGVQERIGSFAVRLEYERISATGGAPDLLSLGVSWTF
jgi:opacity protein-like surface antigen